MKLFTFEFKNNKPKYQELASYIANEIKTKNMKTDEELPSKRVLSSHLGVSINTIINAYNVLLDEGYIYSIPKIFNKSLCNVAGKSLTNSLSLSFTP